VAANFAQADIATTPPNTIATTQDCGNNFWKIYKNIFSWPFFVPPSSSSLYFGFTWSAL